MRTNLIIIASWFAVLTVVACGLTQPELMASLGKTHVTNYGNVNTLTSILLMTVPALAIVLTTVASYSYHVERQTAKA